MGQKRLSISRDLEGRITQLSRFSKMHRAMSSRDLEGHLASHIAPNLASREISRDHDATSRDISRSRDIPRRNHSSPICYVVVTTIPASTCPHQWSGAELTKELEWDRLGASGRGSLLA